MIFATIDQCERIHAMHELDSGTYYSWLQGNSSEYASELSRLQGKVDILQSQLDANVYGSRLDFNYLAGLKE